MKVTTGHMRAYDRSDDLLLRDTRESLETGDHATAIDRLRQRLSRPLPTEDRARGLLLGNLGANLIDLGSESGDEAAVHLANQIYQDFRQIIKEALGSPQFHYNFGNGLKAVFDFERRLIPEWNLEQARLLTSVKNQYWQATRLSDRPPPEHLINLANTLSTSARISEALFWYDRALDIDPQHPMAHGNRSDCLLWLNRLSLSSTLSMIGQIAQGYEYALGSPRVRRPIKENWKSKLRLAQQHLARHNKTTSEVVSDHAETAREAGEHPPYRLFCIREHLMLAEHALYCPCAGARRDSLSILMRQIGLGSEYVPAMEILLNRLKAEFNAARILYYQASASAYPSWDTDSFESTFSDFSEDAAVDLRTELLRTGFRLCFGILDRIAFGICSLLTPELSKNNLYFHTFWGAQGKHRERWDRLNEWSRRLPSLVALYSQSTDFSQTDGEWLHLRNYRNALEHELLIIGPRDGKALGPFADTTHFKSVQIIPRQDFQKEALQLLRFTASAILSFTLLVRQRAYLERREGGGPMVEVAKKALGPD